MRKHMTKKLLAVAVLALLFTSPFSLAAEHGDGKNAEASSARPYNYKTPKLSRVQIDALLAKPEQLLIIDVRRPDEISKIGTFPVYLNVQIDQLESALPFIPKERSIVTVSNHAGRAGKAGDLLLDKGFRVVGAIGSQNYEEEGGKISKIVPPAPKADEHAEQHKAK
jgi:rhodanese-related sulfurtransferase